MSNFYKFNDISEFKLVLFEILKAFPDSEIQITMSGEYTISKFITSLSDCKLDYKGLVSLVRSDGKYYYSLPSSSWSFLGYKKDLEVVKGVDFWYGVSDFEILEIQIDGKELSLYFLENEQFDYSKFLDLVMDRNNSNFAFVTFSRFNTSIYFEYLGDDIYIKKVSYHDSGKLNIFSHSLSELLKLNSGVSLIAIEYGHTDLKANELLDAYKKIGKMRDIK